MSRRTILHLRGNVVLAGVVAATVAACGTTAPQTSRSTASTRGGLQQSGDDGSTVAPSAGPASAPSASTGLPGQPTTPNPSVSRPGVGPVPAATRGTEGSGQFSASQCDIAPTGRGWDTKHVYLGGALQTDAAAVGQSVGFNAFDFGDQKAIADAATQALNEAGGLCGRTAVQVYYDVSSVSDANTEAEAACAKWTQDRGVVWASLVPNINIQNAYACLSKARVPIMTMTGSPSTRAGIAPYLPYLMLRNTMVWDRFVSFYVDRLSALGYFKGWDTTQGRAGAAPVKIGILVQADPIAEQAYVLLKKELERRHIAVVDHLVWNDPQQISSYVLKMRQDGVTHLFLDRLSGLFYPAQAQGQNFYARYALTSQNFIQPFMANGQAPQQLRGAVGIGWQPMIDVDQSHDPGPTAGFAACMALMKKAGVDVSKRNYKFTATAACDGVGLMQRAVHAGRGLTPQQIVTGIYRAAPALPWANMFGAGAHSGEPELLSAARDLVYDAGCSCMRYTGVTRQIP